MAKVHDKFVIELAEVIKGYGNDPDIDDPFCLSEFYRFYELPNIAVSRENFEKMRPVEPERKTGEWIPVSKRFPEEGEEVLVYLFDGRSPYLAWIQDGLWRTEDFVVDADYEPVAWMPLPEPYQAERLEE
jgi:hypothetical protein